MYVLEKTHSLVLSTVSDIQWGSWNISHRDKGGTIVLEKHIWGRKSEVGF